jgi:hypothetical protein
MPARRQILARLSGVRVHRDAERAGVWLRFDPEGPRAPEGPVEDFADLGPALTLASAAGLGRVLRLLRAVRRACPSGPESLLGRPERAARLLSPALGAVLRLEVVPRSTLRFTVWTDAGVDSVDQVLDVVEDDTAFLVRRRGADVPLRVPREQVVRRTTTRETWLEITGIERA